MSNDGKKISFSFSKVKKPPLAKKMNTEKIEYVDCFDGTKGKFSFKGNLSNDETTKTELVIPLISNRTSGDIVKSKIEKKKDEKINLKSNISSSTIIETSSSNTENKSIEEIAASEILQDLKESNTNGQSVNNLVIGSDTFNSNVGEVGEVSEADIDYDGVPVTDFGMAMLRGMGWKPNSGIGKEPRLVPTVSPKLRPRRLGLGAKQIPDSHSEKDN